MAKSRVVTDWVVMFCFAFFVAGCDARTAVTATPSPTPEATNTLAATPTLVTAQETATMTVGPTLAATSTESPAATATPTPVEAQGIERRITFEPGAISATVENAVVSGTRDRYILETQAGQTMRLEISSVEDNAEFQVFAPDGQELPGAAGEGGVWEQELPQSGDYVIVVGPTRGNATYRLEVTIPPLEDPTPSPDEATRISFEPGMASTTVEGRVEAESSALYVLRAVQDQEMIVNVRTSGEPVVLGVRGADGMVFLPFDAAETGLRIVALPATMDYFFEVASTGAATDFQLDVGASPLADLPDRIEFEPGATTAMVSGTLAPGGDLESYIFEAAEGQTVTVEALPADAPLSVYLQSEDAADFFFATEGILVAELSRALDYVLTVSTPNAAGETGYELRITIE